MTVSVLYIFLMVPWVGLQCVIVVFSGHTGADPGFLERGFMYIYRCGVPFAYFI